MRCCRGSNQSMASYKSSAVAEVEMERLGQRTGGGLLIQAAGGGQLGARVESLGERGIWPSWLEDGRSCS